MVYLCNNCTDQFKTGEALQAHIKEAHTGRRRVDFKIAPRKIEEMERVQEQAIKNEEKEVKQDAPVSPIPKEKEEKRKPIELVYIFQGDCPIDGIPVETHEIKIPEGLYQIAWCGNCKKQLTQIKVLPIEDQIKKK